MNPIRRSLLNLPLLGLPGLIPFLATRARAASSGFLPLQGGLAVFAAAEDVMTLLATSNALSERVAQLLLGQREAAHAFAGLWKDPSEPLAVLAAASGGKAPPAPVVASALMWLVHQAVEDELKPTVADEERDIYQDVAVMKAWAGHMEAEAQSSEEAIHLSLQSLERRLFVQLHTFEPDSEDVVTWIEKLIEWHEGRQRLLARYARVWVRPDVAAWRRHVEGKPPLVSLRDPLWPLLVSARNGDRQANDAVQTALRTKAASRYVSAVSSGARRLQRAGAYLEGKLTAAAFTASLRRS